MKTQITAVNTTSEILYIFFYPYQSGQKMYCPINEDRKQNSQAESYKEVNFLLWISGRLSVCKKRQRLCPRKACCCWYFLSVLTQHCLLLRAYPFCFKGVLFPSIQEVKRVRSPKQCFCIAFDSFPEFVSLQDVANLDFSHLSNNSENTAFPHKLSETNIYAVRDCGRLGKEWGAGKQRVDINNQGSG